MQGGCVGVVNEGGHGVLIEPSIQGVGDHVLEPLGVLVVGEQLEQICGSTGQDGSVSVHLYVANLYVQTKGDNEKLIVRTWF